MNIAVDQNKHHMAYSDDTKKMKSRRFWRDLQHEAQACPTSSKKIKKREAVSQLAGEISIGSYWHAWLK
jgi:hypothetical protein